MSNIGQEDFSISLDDGKYRIVSLVGGGFRWYRHDVDWTAAYDLSFSKVVVSMIFRIHELEVELHQAKPKGDAAEVGKRASHYGDGVQPWDLIIGAGWAAEFAAGNVIKYVRRHMNKNGEDDLKKARWYYHELIKMVAASPPDTRDTKRLQGLFDQLELMLTADERKLVRIT